jgi:hypothetical protein
MAKLTDAKPEHRGYAERIPEDIRERLPGEELRYRAEYAAHLHDTAPMGEAGQAMMKHADRVLRSLPLAEFLQRRKELYELAEGTNDPQTHHELIAAVTALGKANRYPAGLQEAGEKVLGGLACNYADADIDLIMGRPSGSSADPRAFGVNSLEKAVHVATADLDERISDLRKQINAEKARIANAYAAANQRPPAGFLTSPSQHPDASKLRELEASAQHYRDKANAVTEHDLSAFYRTEAEDYEDRAAKLRAAIERSV